MELFSTGALLVLAMIAFVNFRDHTLGSWLKSKFLNAGAPHSSGANQGLGSLFGIIPSSSSRATQLGPAAAGAFVAPVPGAGINKPFGNGHPGVDLGYVGINGKPVGAMGSGKVTQAGPSGGCGLMVMIEHSPHLTTKYCHLGSITVHIGDQVAAGQTLGTVDSTGESSGPHLHLEVILDGTNIDPCTFAPVVCGAVASASTSTNVPQVIL